MMQLSEEQAYAHSNKIRSQEQQMRKIKSKLRRAKLDKEYALSDLKIYMTKLTQRQCSELETLLARLNIVIPEYDLSDILALGIEYVSETAKLDNTAIEANAEQDLEKYLSKLTSEKREELEDILGRFKEASSKLAELQQHSSTQTAQIPVTPDPLKWYHYALIWGGVVIISIPIAILLFGD